MAFNPVNYLYTTSTAFIAQKALYKEWRLKQCKVHAMLQDLTLGALAQWTNGQTLISAHGWVRNAAYTAGVPVQYATMAIQPDIIQKVWNLGGAVPEFWTSCTAGTGAGEGNWLNTSFAPATAPNTGMFFMPELKVNTELVNAAADGVLNFVYEIECIVEFRGSLQ